MSSYLIQRAGGVIDLDSGWDSPLWRQVMPADIAHFHPAGSAHQPRAQVKAQYDPEHLHLFFRVEDRFVRARQTQAQQMVCQDSCVEFFFSPKPGRGYFNFEINCIGAALLQYHPHQPRSPMKLEDGILDPVQVRTSMAGPIESEIAGPLVWTVRLSFPFSILESVVGKLTPVADTQWTGNFYKCADDSSHPHWGAWAGIGEELNFHQPGRFAPLHFAS